MPRRTSTQLGSEAEQLAVAHLTQRGYRIVETNYRVRGGELDIIALDGDVMAFVEVRSRRSTRWGHPLETVSRAKQLRLLRAAQRYLVRSRQLDRQVRFDVLAIVIEPRRQFQLVQDAFDASSR